MEGEELIAAADRLGMETGLVYRSEDLPTDVYMAVEGANGLIAAIADAHSLEAAGDKILRPLADGRLGSADAPYQGLIALVIQVADKKKQRWIALLYASRPAGLFFRYRDRQP